VTDKVAVRGSTRFELCTAYLMWGTGDMEYR